MRGFDEFCVVGELRNLRFSHSGYFHCSALYKSVNILLVVVVFVVYIGNSWLIFLIPTFSAASVQAVIEVISVLTADSIWCFCRFGRTSGRASDL